MDGFDAMDFGLYSMGMNSFGMNNMILSDNEKIVNQANSHTNGQGSNQLFGMNMNMLLNMMVLMLLTGVAKQFGNLVMTQMIRMGDFIERAYKYCVSDKSNSVKIT